MHCHDNITECHVFFTMRISTAPLRGRPRRRGLSHAKVGQPAYHTGHAQGVFSTSDCPPTSGSGRGPRHWLAGNSPTMSGETSPATRPGCTRVTRCNTCVMILLRRGGLYTVDSRPGLWIWASPRNGQNEHCHLLKKRGSRCSSISMSQATHTQGITLDR